MPSLFQVGPWTQPPAQWHSDRICSCGFIIWRHHSHTHHPRGNMAGRLREGFSLSEQQVIQLTCVHNLPRESSLDLDHSKGLWIEIYSLLMSHKIEETGRVGCWLCPLHTSCSVIDSAAWLEMTGYFLSSWRSYKEYVFINADIKRQKKKSALVAITLDYALKTWQLVSLFVILYWEGFEKHCICMYVYHLSLYMIISSWWIAILLII